MKVTRTIFGDVFGAQAAVAVASAAETRRAAAAHREAVRQTRERKRRFRPAGRFRSRRFNQRWRIAKALPHVHRQKAMLRRRPAGRPLVVARPAHPRTAGKAIASSSPTLIRITVRPHWQ